MVDQEKAHRNSVQADADSSFVLAKVVWEVGFGGRRGLEGKDL
jgi:hypothetical protein